MRQPQTGIELQLVVLRLHMAAQLIEGFVVLFLLQVRQLMHHDHPQKRLRRVAEHRRHADFGFRFQLAALNARNGGMQAERIFQTWILLSYITLLIGAAPRK
jgi:hypothetical protein